MITFADVVPPIGACQAEELPALLALTRLDPERIPSLPADFLLREVVIDDRLVAPATAALASDLMRAGRFSDIPLASLLPDLPRCAGSAGAGLSVAAIVALADVHGRDWSDLSAVTLRDLEQASEASAVPLEIFAAAIREAAATGLRLAPPRPADGGRKPDEALALLASWGLGELGLSRFGELLARIEHEEVRPAEVDEAWERLLDKPLTDIGGRLAERFDLTAALRRLLTFTPREMLVIDGRVFAGPVRRTLDDLGTELNVSRERIRQIEDQLKKKLALMLDQDEFAVVHRAAARLKRQMGECLRIDSAPPVARWALGVAEAPSHERRLHAQVLMSFAGPFELREPWIVRAPAARITGIAQERILNVLADGPLPLPDVSEALSEVGIPDSEHGLWLQDICKCREVDGLVIPWTGSMADKAERVLQLRGEPLSPEEIAEALGPSTNLRSLTMQIQDDTRFLRRGLKRYGLAAWGGEEYTTIQDEIAEEIERQGGSASIDLLVETLCSQFGVAASSVRAYASQPPFVRTSNGLVTIGSGDVRFDRVPIEDTRGCFRVGTHWALRIRVDSEILRGSGRAIPPGVLQHLGLRPQDRRHLKTPVGDLLVNYGRQATIGSLRPAALSLDCADGDLLFVILRSDESIEFDAVRGDRLRQLQGVERLAAEVGAEIWEDPIVAVSYALGLPPDEYRPDAIRRRLRARKETDLLELVPGDEGPASDEDILRELMGLD